MTRQAGGYSTERARGSPCGGLAGRRGAVAVAIVAAAALAAGCGAGTAPSPDEIVRRAVRAQGELKSVRVRLDIKVELIDPSGGPPHQQGVYLGEGHYEQPGRSSLTLRSTAGETSVVTVGDTVYVKAPGSAGWAVRKMEEEPAAGASPEDVASYLESTRDLRLVDSAGDTYELQFELDMGSYAGNLEMPGIDGSVFSGTSARMEVQVLKDSFFVKRMKMDFRGNLDRAGAGGLSVRMEFDFSDFNRPVTIEAPI